MSRNAQYLYLVAAMLAFAPAVAEAALVTRTTTTPIAISNVATTINFADLIDADQLVSISAGSVNSFEGGSFSISVNYSSGSTVQIFSNVFAHNEPYRLTSVPTITFTPGTVTGLTFQTFIDRVPVPPTGTLPTGTVFTFRTVTAVPEPVTWTAMVVGFGLIGSTLRARRRRSSVVAL